MTGRDTSSPKPKAGNRSPDTAGRLKASGTAGSVLAVLVLASLWDEEFKGGWIRDRDVVKYADVPYLEEDQPDAIRQAFYRARTRFSRQFPQLEIREQTVPYARIRLVKPLPADVEEWFSSAGLELIRAAYREQFLANQIRPPSSVREALRGLDETVGRILMIQGRKEEAFQLLDHALASTTSPTRRASLLLSLAFALIRVGELERFEEVIKTLARMADKDLPPGDFAVALLRARIYMEVAYGTFLTTIVARNYKGDVPRQLAKCRTLLRRAQLLAAGMSPGDQARLVNIDALLTKAMAQVNTGKERGTLFDTAAKGYQRSFALARSVWDVYGMGAALYNLGELHYVRYHLRRPGATEEQIMTALDWFRASIHLGERLQTNRDFVLDHCRVAEILGLLILTRARSGTRDGLEGLLQEAEGRLEFARQHASPLELQLADRADGRLTIYTRKAGIVRSSKAQAIARKGKAGPSR